MRHVLRTHRVALGWLFDRMNLDPKIQIKKVDTKKQLADIMTKGSFLERWVESLSEFFRHSGSHLKSFLSFQATECIVIGAMSKRGQDMTSRDGSPEATARPTNLVMHGQCKEDVSPRRWRSLVNPENDNNRKRVSLVPENWGRKLEVPKCIDKRRSI